MFRGLTLFTTAMLLVLALKSYAQVSGGMVMTPSGDSVVYTCPGDGLDDIVMFDSTSQAGEQYQYVITSSELEILGMPPSDWNNFEGAGEGTCLVWGVSYTGTWTAQVGDDAGTVSFSDGTFDLSSNAIEVRRYMPKGGWVSTPAGDTTVRVNSGNGTPDEVQFQVSGQSMANHAYVITDDNNMILGLPGGNMNDFDGAPAGTCRVWGLSFTGDITAQIGDDAAAVVLSDGCFELSTNYIEIVRVPESEVNGGWVSTPVGDTEVYTCPGDGIKDTVWFDNNSQSVADYQYVITNEDLVILGAPMADFNEFDGAGEGTCLVWGVSYTGNWIAQPGDLAGSDPLSDGDFDISANSIMINRFAPVGGWVSTPAGDTVMTITSQNGTPDEVWFDRTGESGAKYTYVITDDNNMVLGLPMTNFNDFDGAPAGTCRVWGLSYTGELLVNLGDDASAVQLSDGCFDLSSNYIEIVRIGASEVNGGLVMTHDGMTEVYTCPDDAESDVVSFDSTSQSSASYQYVITDESLMILGLPGGDMNDFEGAGEGVCLVWGVSYTGNWTASAGDNAGVVALSDGDFDLSDNSIRVVRSIPMASEVSAVGLGDTVFTCVGDGGPDIVQFQKIVSDVAQFQYVVTDPNLEILGLPGDELDFEGAGAGTCLVWGLTYAGQLWAEVGDTVSNVELASSCYELSADPIVVVREINMHGCITGIRDVSNLEVDVYPNPANDRIFVDGQDSFEFEVFDVNGALVKSGESSNQIDTADLEAGLYSVVIRTNEGQSRQNLMIAR